MKYSEARQRLMAVRELINYCHAKGIESIHLNYAFNRNLKIFTTAEEEIIKSAPEKLKELEKKAIELGKAIEGEKNHYEAGLKLLSEEELAQYNEASEKFKEYLNEESDYKAYNILMDKVQDFPFDFYHTDLLMMFTE